MTQPNIQPLSEEELRYKIEHTNCTVEELRLIATIRAKEEELKKEKQYAGYKDETATTFMNQVKKLQQELANANKGARINATINTSLIEQLTASQAKVKGLEDEFTEYKRRARIEWQHVVTERDEQRSRAERATELLAGAELSVANWKREHDLLAKQLEEAKSLLRQHNIYPFNS